MSQALYLENSHNFRSAGKRAQIVQIEWFLFIEVDIMVYFHVLKYSSTWVIQSI